MAGWMNVLPESLLDSLSLRVHKLLLGRVKGYSVRSHQLLGKYLFDFSLTRLYFKLYFTRGAKNGSLK